MLNVFQRVGFVMSELGQAPLQDAERVAAGAGLDHQVGLLRGQGLDASSINVDGKRDIHFCPHLVHALL